MALMNIKALMKQKTMAPVAMPGAVSAPFAPTGTPPVAVAPAGLLKKGLPKPSQSTEVQKMPNLMKRLTGK